MDSVLLTSYKEDIAGANLLLSLFASMLSVSCPFSGNEPLIMQSNLHFPLEDKAKTMKGNIFSSNDVRGFIFLFESIAV
jgi:hypothetical protein